MVWWFLWAILVYRRAHPFFSCCRRFRIIFPQEQASHSFAHHALWRIDSPCTPVVVLVQAISYCIPCTVFFYEATCRICIATAWRFFIPSLFVVSNSIGLGLGCHAKEIFLPYVGFLLGFGKWFLVVMG